MERTYIMLKPDAFEKKVVGKVISMIEEAGFKIVATKLFQLSAEMCDEHYDFLVEKPFYPSIREFMMSGPVLGMVVEGENAILGMRQLMGPTKYDPIVSEGTIRGKFQDRENMTKNIIHGSDSPENAEIEIKRFFGKKQYKEFEL